MIKRMERGLTSGKMDPSILVTLRMIIGMATDRCIGKMDESTRVNGSMGLKRIL